MKLSKQVKQWKAGALCVFAFCAMVPASWGNREEAVDAGRKIYEPNQPPREVNEADITQKLKAQVPLDLSFRNDHGEMVQLKEYFGEKPVVLTLVYYECPMLCNLVLDGYMECLNDERSFDVGEEFISLTVSIDHEETHVLAAGKKSSYLEVYNRDNDGSGWPFLVGDEASVKKLADAVGFGFKFDPQSGEFAHRSALIVLTPEGKVSRYFPGIQYDPKDLRLGLVEASDNKIGSLVDRLFLLCYHYDPALGKYGLIITNVINFACIVTLVLVLTSIAMFLRLERRNRKSKQLLSASA